jgi:tetratricopeptide (TPR) repeat protein
MLRFVVFLTNFGYYKINMAKNIFFVILALPVLISQFLFFPSAWGKAEVFRILMIFLIYAFIFCLVFEKIKIEFSKIKKIKIIWLFILLLALAALSTIFSKDPYFSFWGDPQRAGGFLNFALLLIFSILAFFLVKKNQWQKLWDFNFIVASIIAILAFIIPHSDRISSTLGGPAILALYMALLLPMALFLFISSKKRMYLFYSALFFLVIFLTASRGVLLGLLAAFLYYILSGKNKLWLKFSCILLILLLLAGVFILRPVNIQDRLSVWTISFKALQEKPLLGFGPENFNIAFNKYYDSSLPGLNSQWFDRAHNIIFDLAVPFGLPFFIVYVLIFVILFFKVRSPAVKTGFIIYFVSNLFNFDAFSTYLIIFLFLAYSLSLAHENPAEWTEKEKNHSPFLQIAMIIIFLLLLPAIWIISVKPLYINEEMNKASYEKNMKAFDNILSTHSFLDSYIRTNYAVTASLVISSKPSLQEALPLMEKSITVLEESAQLRPNNAKTWYMLSFFANELLKYENSDELKQKALGFCQKAKELSPNHSLIVSECQF